MITIMITMMIITMEKIMIGKISLEKCNYSMENGKTSFKGQ